MADRPRTYMAQDDRRQQLLAFGMRLFGEHSYEDVSIDDIARAAGISRGLMYHYFGSKRAFYTEVVRSAADQLIEALEPDPNLDNAHNLLRGLNNYFRFVDEHANAWVALMNGGLGTDADASSIIRDARARISHQIIDQMGESNPPPRLRAAVWAWVGSVEACALDWLAHRDLDVPDLVSMLSQSLFSMVGPDYPIDPPHLTRSP